VALLARAARLAPAEQRQKTFVAGGSPPTPWPKTPAENRPVILVDRGDAQSAGLPANEITLHAASNPGNSVGYDKNSCAALMGRHDWKFLTPDDILLAEAIPLPGPAALVNSWLPNRLEGQPMVNGNPVTPLPATFRHGCVAVQQRRTRQKLPPSGLCTRPVAAWAIELTL